MNMLIEREKVEEQEGGGRWLWLRGALATLLLLGVGVVGWKGLASMRKKPQRKVLRASSLVVRTQGVRWGREVLVLEGFGTTEASKKVEVAPELSGKVVYVSPRFRRGGRVRKGEVLFRVDTRDARLDYGRAKRQLSSLRGQIKLAKAALRLDARYLGRNGRLLKRKAIDAGQYERLRIAHLERKQRLASLEQSASSAQVALRSAALRLRKARVVSPFAGRVTKADVDAGDFVSMGRAVGALESRDAVLLSVSFSLEELRKVRGGRGERIDVERLTKVLATLPPVEVFGQGAGKSPWKGRVVRVGSRLDLQTRTLPVWVEVRFARKEKRSRKRRKRRGRGGVKQQADVSQRTLLPGVFCRVRIPVRRLSRAVRLPKRALVGADAVYVVEGGRLGKRQVKVAHVGSTYAIVSDGLREGAQVVVSRLEEPIVGTRVRVEAVASSDRRAKR